AFFTIHVWTIPILFQLRSDIVNVGVLIAGLVLVMVGVAIAEQFFGLLVPGTFSLFGYGVRPASITGAMQHYAIVIALLCLCSGHLYVTTYRMRYFIIALIAGVGAVLSLTRSGPMIIAMGCLYAGLRYARDN